MKWFTNLYFAEGPGIPKDAPKPKGLRLLASILGREWWELLKLNLLFIAVALPLVTLPAAYLAMTRICVAMVDDRNVYLWRDFQETFRGGFWKATGLGAFLVSATALAGLATSTYATATADNLLFAAPLAIAVTIMVLVPLLGVHMFVALADNVDRSLPETLKAAAFATLARPLPGLAALGFTSLLWLAHILFYPVSVLLPVLVNFSLGALVTAFAALGGTRFGFSHIAAVPGQRTTRRPKTQSA